jgi:hypothetical protein
MARAGKHYCKMTPITNCLQAFYKLFAVNNSNKTKATRGLVIQTQVMNAAAQTQVNQKHT